MNTLINIPSAIISGSVYGIVFLFLIIIIIFFADLISGGIEKLKKPGKQNIPLKEIIKDEYKEVRHKEINLSVFANEIYCVANNVKLYLRNKNKKGEPDYIILLETDNGNLVELGLDYFHANDEFVFICEEDEVSKDGANITINLFSYKLFDKNLEKEISIQGNILSEVAAA